MKLKFKKQVYQTNAVDAVADCFAGQPKREGLNYRVDPGRSLNEMEGFKNADLALTPVQMLENIHAVQRRQNLPLSAGLVKTKVCDINLDVEMETGTGKTYCYVKSMFELNARYGWSKFIVVVPSIAIREGVFKSLEITAEHFLDEYKKRARFFIYNSKQLHNLESFSSDAGINVMVINVQAHRRHCCQPAHPVPRRAAEDGRRQDARFAGQLQAAGGAALFGHAQDDAQQNPPVGRAGRLQPKAGQENCRAWHIGQGADWHQCLPVFGIH